MGRAPCCEKVGLRKGKWTTEEDELLTKYIQANGEGKWRSLPKNAGLLRCGKSCRLRWVNYLKSDLKRGKFSTHEDETIIKLHSSLGNRWCLIASHLPGRTDNEIKNYWNSRLSRRTYNYQKFIKELKQQQVVVDHPVKSGSNNIVIKKKKSKNLNPNPTPENLVEKSTKATSSSQEVDNGGGTLLMPSTPALEENVMSSMQLETMDDIFLDYDFCDMVFDGLEAGPAEVPSLQISSQLGDQNGEILFTNDEVENWLMGEDFTGDLESDLFNISSNAENGAPPSSKLNDELDSLGWDWNDLILDEQVQVDGEYNIKSI